MQNKVQRCWNIPVSIEYFYYFQIGSRTRPDAVTIRPAEKASS